MRTLMLTGFFIANTSWASEATDRAESALATIDAATLAHLESVQPRATRAGWLRIVDDTVVSVFLLRVLGLMGLIMLVTVL